MNGATGVRPPPAEVPILTEVIGFEASDSGSAPDPDAEGLPAAVALLDRSVPEEQITQRVMADLQRHVDLMFEYRLRESLTPVLSRLADNLVREVREELSTTLRDVVRRAVSQELARQKVR